MIYLLKLLLLVLFLLITSPITVGAYWIHPGFGLMVLGVMGLVGLGVVSGDMK